jgi:hypothetical protein
MYIIQNMLNMYNMKPYVYYAYALTLCIFSIFCIFRIDNIWLCKLLLLFTIETKTDGPMPG